MRRFEELQRLDKKTRNKVRAILSNVEVNAIERLAQLRGKLGRDQADALDVILNSPVHLKAVRMPTPFPRKPPFGDTLQAYREFSLDELLCIIETNVVTHEARLNLVANSLRQIDAAYAAANTELCRKLIVDAIECNGWSHAILRRIILIRENLPEGKEDDKIEALAQQADLKEVVVASLIHSYSLDQNILTIKRSILNIADRGAINRYSRSLSRLAVQPFARSKVDLAAFLSEVEKCSLIDAVILAKFNSHLFTIEDYPAIEEIAKNLGQAELFEKLVATYDSSDSDSEYAFFKQWHSPKSVDK